MMEGIGTDGCPMFGASISFELADQDKTFKGAWSSTPPKAAISGEFRPKCRTLIPRNAIDSFGFEGLESRSNVTTSPMVGA
jgi:hypothetical protein